MMNQFKFIAILFTFLTFSCTKSEGIGGRSSIKGKVIIDNINIIDGTIENTYDAQDVDVFIIYGNDNNNYNDDQSTSYDGSFEFNYLNKGYYEVFVYSDCQNCPKGQDSVIIQSITINESNTVNELDTIRIANYI